jgi:hypothetical protein
MANFYFPLDSYLTSEGDSEKFEGGLDNVLFILSLRLGVGPGAILWNAGTALFVQEESAGQSNFEDEGS